MAALLKAIDGSDTELMFTGDANFPQDDGVIQIDSEIITYTTIYMGTMYGCLRGAKSTSAASHLIDSPIVLIDFFSFPADETFETLNATTVNAVNINASGVITQAQTYSAPGSNQGIASDETLTPEAGRDKGEGGSFQAAIMGNVHATTLAETGNYVAGVIGAYSVTSTNASELPSGAVIGDIQDPSNSANGIFTAVIDGNDPSGVTRAGAAFKARSLNDNAGSGVDYGLDLFDTAVSGYLSSPTLPLAIAKADIRMTNQVCILNGSSTPTNGVTGATFAAIGSLYMNRTSGVLYSNTGTQTSPVWTPAGGTPVTPSVVDSVATVGGAATESVVVTGLLTTSTIWAVTQRTKGGADLPLLSWTNTLNGSLTVIYSADMGVGAVVRVLFIP